VPKPQIVVVGDSLVDLVGGPDGRTYVAHPGGSPMNVAFGPARPGRPTALLTRLGDDAFGTSVQDHLTQAGVELLAAPDAGFTTEHGHGDGRR
jgi:fructokinase